MGAPRTGRARARAGVQLVLRAAAARIAARGAGVRQQIGRRESARGRVPQPWRAAAAPHARAVRERSGRRACGTHSRTKHHASEAKRSRDADADAGCRKGTIVGEMRRISAKSVRARVRAWGVRNFRLETWQLSFRPFARNTRNFRESFAKVSRPTSAPSGARSGKMSV